MISTLKTRKDNQDAEKKICFVLAIASFSVAQSKAQTYVVDGLTRVGQSSLPGFNSSMNLSGARGETLDSQIVVFAPVPVLPIPLPVPLPVTIPTTILGITASPLLGPSGATIPASSFTFYREQYVSVQGSFVVAGSNPPLGAGTYPEPLIPFADPESGLPLTGTIQALPFTIQPGQNQPFWVDVAIPRGVAVTPPGVYSGTIAVLSNLGLTTIPVSINVWNFELPLVPSLMTHFTLGVNAGAPSLAQLSSLARNKVFSMNASGVQAKLLQVSFGLNRASLGESFGWNFVQCAGGLNDVIPAQAAIATAALAYPSGVPLDLYASDETIGCTGALTNIKLLANNAHGAGVKLLDTVPPTASLYSFIDYWVVLPVNWPASMSGVPGAIWSYTSCNVGNGSTPRWDVDFPPLDERIQAGFLNQTQGATGLLYWTVDQWTSGDAAASWTNLNTSACGVAGSGDGKLLYPASPIGSSEAAPGIRLKAIRDGIQDYEYVQIMKGFGLAGAVFISSTLQPIATSWSNWTKSSAALLAARSQLGMQINLLNTPALPPPAPVYPFSFTCTVNNSALNSLSLSCSPK